MQSLNEDKYLWATFTNLKINIYILRTYWKHTHSVQFLITKTVTTYLHIKYFNLVISCVPDKLYQPSLWNILLNKISIKLFSTSKNIQNRKIANEIKFSRNWSWLKAFSDRKCNCIVELNFNAKIKMKMIPWTGSR